MIVLGGISFFAPALALQGVAYFHQGPRIYIAVAVRLVVGLIFVASAKPSRAPWLMYFFGGFTLVGAVLTPFSNAFEVKLTGTFDDPEWRLVLGPSSLIRSLTPGGPDEEKPAAPPATTAPSVSLPTLP